MNSRVINTSTICLILSAMLLDCTLFCQDTTPLNQRYDIRPGNIIRLLKLSENFLWRIDYKDNKAITNYKNFLEIWDPVSMESFLSVYVEASTSLLALGHNGATFLENGPALNSGKNTIITIELSNGYITTTTDFDNTASTAVFPGAVTQDREYELYAASNVTTVTTSGGSQTVLADGDGLKGSGELREFSFQCK